MYAIAMATCGDSYCGAFSDEKFKCVTGCGLFLNLKDLHGQQRWKLKN